MNATLTSQSSIIQTLIKGCKSISVVSSTSSIPPGCAVTSLSTSLSSHLLVRGLVDIEQELKKLDKKLDITTSSIERIEAQTKKSDWEKTPQEIKDTTLEKLETLKAEKIALENGKKNFESIRDSN